MTQATHRGRSPIYAGLGATSLTLILWFAVMPAHPGSPEAPPGSATLEYRLPVDDVVLRRFERPAQRWSRGHRGVDVSATAGTPVLAPADGVVTVSRTVVDRDVLTIKHPDGLRSSLEPLADGLPEGTLVAAGAVVGTVAGAGAHCGTAVCLHWGVRRGTEYLDPLSLLPGASPVVLLSREASRRSPGASPAAGASRPCASARCVTR
jgi:murein DD-endopeptidase MepM/ murein hydrolase activator NlpD